MAVYRVHKNRDYTVISNTHIRDKRLTLKAKGLLTMMLSFPDDWDYSISGLVACTSEGETAVKSALNELKKNGYVTVTKLMPDKATGGRLKYQYDIYEQPQEIQEVEIQEVEKQCIENLPLEILPVENPAQLNTNKPITKEVSTKEQNTDREKRTRFVPPTVEDVKEYCFERHNGIDAQAFVDYYTARDWMLGKTKMKDWKAAVRTWENREKKTEKTGGRLDWIDDVF